MHLAPPIAHDRVRPLRRIAPSLRAGREDMMPFPPDSSDNWLRLPGETGQVIGDAHWPVATTGAGALAPNFVTASLQGLIEHTSAAPPAPTAARTLPPVAARPIRGATVAGVPPLAFGATPVSIPRLTALPLRPRFRFGPPPPPASAPVPTAANPAFGPPPQEFFRRPEPGPPAAALYRRAPSATGSFYVKPEPLAAAAPPVPSPAPAMAPPLPSAPLLSAASAAPIFSEPEMSMANTPNPEQSNRPQTPSPAEPLSTFTSGPQAGTAGAGMNLGAKIGIALGVILIGVAGYFFTLQSPGTTVAASTNGIVLPADKTIGWTNEFAGDAQGAAKGRHLLLLRQSLKAANYDFQFDGKIADKSLGWVVHAADARNYYAMRIDILQPGPLPKVSFYKYAVVNGQEGPRVSLPLPVTVRDSTVFRVHVKSQNGTITTTIQDQLVDVWNDDRVQAGAAGFVTELGERAIIQSVEYSEKR